MKRLFCIFAILIMTVCLFTACDFVQGSLPDTSPKEDVITVVDGYLVVNGVKTEYKVDKDDVITVEDGYLVVNGVRTEYKVDKDDVITVVDGYLVVNGVKTEYEVKNNNHDFGDWKLYNPDAKDCENKLYFRTCYDCNSIEWRDGKYEDHKFNTVTTKPTCQAGGFDTKTCTLCGKVEVCNEKPKTGHDYGMQYLSDSNYHWKECKTCGEDGTKTAHIIENGICMVCDPSAQPTEGVMYDISEDGTYAEVIAYEGSSGRVKIAEEYKGLPVKNIYNNAFKNNTTITEVIIPDSVINIGEFAFSECYNLNSVVIGDGVTTIGFKAFDYCSSLISVVIPDSVTTIGNSAFSRCYGLTSVVIPDSVTTIDYEAFYYCNSLTSVVIGNNVTTIGSGAFYSCINLTSVVIPDSVATIGSYAFFYCDSLIYNEYGNCKYLGNENNPYLALIETTSDNYSSFEIHPDTKIIAGDAFSGCSRLTSIVIPDSVTTIGENAFYNCSSLNSVVIGDNVTTIGGSAFSSCSSLTSVVIGDSVTTIGSGAFSSCSSLTSVVIPDSVTTIGESAFGSCSSLTSVVIGDSVTTIDYGAFYECTSLKDVYYTGSEEDWQKITINNLDYFNGELISSNIHFNYAP